MIAVAAAVFLGFWVGSPRGTPLDPLAIPEVVPQEHRSGVLLLEDRWLVRSSAPADSSPSALREFWRDCIVDPDALLSESQKDLLLRSLAAHAVARASGVPDSYLRLSDSEDGYRWIEDGSEEWVSHGIDAMWRYEFGVPAPARDARGSLAQIWRHACDDRGHRFESIGVGPDGAWIQVRRVRTASPGPDPNVSEESVQNWLATAMNGRARHFRVPVVSIDERIVREGSAIQAECNFIVRCANGLLTNWRSKWVWEPEASRWVCAEMLWRGGRLAQVFF